MKLRLAAVAVISLSTISAAQAVTLHNKDSRSYDIRVTGSSTMSTSIQGGTVKNNICSSCNIEVKGVGDIDASGSDYVIIKGGELSLK
jgi:hypothetical protein